MITVKDLAVNLQLTSQKLIEGAIADAGPEIEVIAVSEMKRGMIEQVSPDGKPYPPLILRIRGGNKRLLDRGVLAGSLTATCTPQSLTLSAVAPGARVQQFGATIVPVRAKALAIPITKRALYAGSPRNFGPGLFPVKGGLATKDETPGKRGKYGTKVKAKITMQYIFKKRVVVPATPYLGLSDEAAGMVSNSIGIAALRRMNQAMGIGK